MVTTVADRLDHIFVDTNILVYAIVKEMPLHQSSKLKLEKCIGNKVSLWISVQIIREVLAVLTRLGQFEQDISPVAATEAVRKLLPLFQVADVKSSVTKELLDIMIAYDVKGKQVHDANIVATMQAYELSNLLTENSDDFKHYQDRITIFTLGTLPIT